MKRTFLSAFVLIALVCSSTLLCVSAHPGRTDSNGGHTDHDTGEYHYHHGYAAHDHYDIDGDGDIDCPYDFKDKTDHTSGNSNGVASNREDDTKIENPKFFPEVKQRTLADVLSAILEVLPEAIAIWLFSSYFLSYLFFLLLGKDRGCSISMISGAVITLIASIWLIVNRLS